MIVFKHFLYLLFPYQFSLGKSELNSLYSMYAAKIYLYKKTHIVACFIAYSMLYPKMLTLLWKLKLCQSLNTYSGTHTILLYKTSLYGSTHCVTHFTPIRQHGPKLSTQYYTQYYTQYTPHTTLDVVLYHTVMGILQHFAHCTTYHTTLCCKPCTNSHYFAPGNFKVFCIILYTKWKVK